MLNYDFCKRNIIDSSLCLCRKMGDAYQLFFVCKYFSIVRNNLFDSLFMLEFVNIDINLF